jgi:GAF domain-containing protein/HAMP domain-containing protein
LVALLVANLSVLFFFGRAIQDGVAARQQLAAKEAANTVAGFIQEKFKELEATVKIGEPPLASEQGQRDTLGKLLGLVPAFRQSILFDAQGRDLVMVSRISQGAAQELLARIEPDLLAQTRLGNRYVSPVYIDELTSEPMMVLAVPAIDALGQFQGTLLAEVNLKSVWDLVDRLQIGEEGKAYVVDRQGNLLAFGDISRVLRGENVSRLDLVNEFENSLVPVGQAVTRMVEGIDDTLVVGTYVPLGVPDWAVVTELPLIEALGPGIQSTAVLGVVMLLVAALVGAVAVVIARRLAAPLLDLTETAGRIAGGEMALRATLTGPSEVVDLANAFNVMTVQLQELIGGLEERVAERTAELQRRFHYLEAAADVGRATSSILEPEILIQEVVDLICEQFDLYYAGLFLLDDSGEWAVLQAGTGLGGQALLARNHRLQVGGESMIGWCTARGEARVALEAGEDAVRLATPELPETRSEAALPLRSRGRVIGALTVQDDEPGAFDPATMAVLQTMADQVAVALENARLFSDRAQALEMAQRAYGELSQEAWIALLQAQPHLGFRSDRHGLRPADDEQWRPEAAEAVRAGRTVVRGDSPGAEVQEPSPEVDAGDGAGDEQVLAIPLRVRGEVIGVLDTYKPAEAGPWTAEEIALLERIVEEMDPALESARLYQDTQRRAAREQAIRQVTERMRRAVDVEAILQNTVVELARAMGAPRAYVRLGTPEPLGAESQGDGEG